MRHFRRRHVGVLIVLLLALVVPAGTASASGSERRLPTKTAEVNEITVEVSPRRVDDRGAVISVILDTHSGDLEIDLEQQSTLTVGGEAWPAVSYRGDGPGGHHREGTLRFDSGGPATGSVRLVIKGLGSTVKFSWRLKNSS
jgi:hypothetical protein